MKKFFFAFPALALAFFLTQCQKADAPETTVSPDHNTEVTSRAPCTIQVFSDNVQPITFCGTLTNKNTCNGCNSLTSTGEETVFGNGSFVNVNSTTFSITTASAGGSFLTLISGNVKQVFVPAGGCVDVTMDANCNFQ